MMLENVITTCNYESVTHTNRTIEYSSFPNLVDITLFRSITLLRGIDGIPGNIPCNSQPIEYGEYSLKYCQSRRTLLWIWIMLWTLLLFFQEFHIHAISLPTCLFYKQHPTELTKLTLSPRREKEQTLPIRSCYLWAFEKCWSVKYSQHWQGNDPGSALKVKIRNTRECVLMAYPLQYLALK